jgi:hypothetical protein
LTAPVPPPKPRLILCACGTYKPADSVAHAPRTVLREGKWIKIDCQGNRVE